MPKNKKVTLKTRKGCSNLKSNMGYSFKGIQMFEEDGILVVKDFIHKDTLKNLNIELDEVFSKISVNGGSYCNIAEQRGALEVSEPALLMSVNIFEVIIDIVSQFKKNSKKFGSEDFILNTLQIQSHKNMPPTPWHTDKRGDLRAILYLKGGKETSGMFSYMRGTSKKSNRFQLEQNEQPEPRKPLGGHYWLSQNQVEEYSDKIVVCSAPEGSLILFDDAGYHLKNACIEERRTLWLSFSPRMKQAQRGISRILLSSNHLTKKVMQNIDLFSNLEFNLNNVGLHNREKSLKHPKPLPLKYYFKGFHRSLFQSIVENLKSCADSHPKLKNLLFSIKFFFKART